MTLSVSDVCIQDYLYQDVLAAKCVIDVSRLTDWLIIKKSSQLWSSDVITIVAFLGGDGSDDYQLSFVPFETMS